MAQSTEAWWSIGHAAMKKEDDASEAYPRAPHWLEQPQIGYHFAQVSNE